MNSWNQLLAQHGARDDESASTQLLDFGRTLGAVELAAGFVAPVSDPQPDAALNSEESASFLDNQLTNDVEHLGQGEAPGQLLLSPKGRLMATFLMWRSPETIFLQLPRAIQAPLQSIPGVRAARQDQA